jgi:cell division protein FtsB
MEKKLYVLTSGKHRKDGKTYVKGDSIELTDQEAKGLANKIVDPESMGISTDSTALQAENEKLKARIEELEQELEEIKEGLEEE